MKKIITGILVLAMLVVASGCAPKEAPAPLTDEQKQSVKNVSMEFLDNLLVKKDYEKAHTFLSEPLQKSYSVQMLAGLSSQIETMLIKANGIIEEDSTVEEQELQGKQAGVATISVDCEYVTAQIVVAMFKDTKVSLFNLIKTEPKQVRALPSTITEQNIILNEGKKFPLNGEITLPKGATEKMPAVVLVHGSGGNDMNESIGANQPFRDIAYMLAEHGIVVLRYDKRTSKYPEFVDGEDQTIYSIDDETIQDAVAGVELLRARSEVDPNRVYIVGHSLGGMMAPRIAKSSGNVAGVVSLAGSPRTLWEIIIDQVSDRLPAMKEAKDPSYDTYVKMIESDKKACAKLDEMSDKDAQKKSMQLMPVSLYYLKDLQKFNAAELVKEQNLPILVMQGGMDRQVYANKDYTAWQEQLKGYEKATFKLYDDLNHLFTPYTNNDNLTGYALPGSVPNAVVDDIASWIKAN